ncbi:hypothetical protein GCM10023340_34260 [Nocardioides marinquilinus]|uniref:Transglutaminase domain-containing protein n=1 Tax=Nocardioides marinquilinus TaxID=1210400 RepID=A0ABP9PVR5_9ACTN
MTTARGALLDAVMVLVTTGVVLSVLDVTFASRGYLVVGLAPVVLAVVLAAWLARVEHGGWFYAVAMILLYAPVGALVALKDPGDYVVPSTSTTGRVLGETPTAPLDLVSTLPPVVADGTVMLVPFAIGYLAGGTAAWLALGTRRPFVPAVPVLVGLAAAIFVGSSAPGSLLLRAGVVAVLCLWWAAVRQERVVARRPGDRSPFAQLVVAALTIGVVSTVVTSVLPVADATDRVVLRGRAAERVDTADVSDPWSLHGAGRRELLRATGVPRGTPVRFAALDQYDGTAWVAAERSPGDAAEGTFQRVGGSITPLTDGDEVTVEVRIRPGYRSDWLPTVGELTSLELDYTGGRTLIDQVRYNQSTGTALVVDGVDPRDRYTLTAVLPETRWSPSTRAAEIDGDQRQPAGRALDRYLRPFERLRTDPMQRLVTFMRYLRTNGLVRLDGASPQTTDDLGRDFLGARRVVGTPHQYTALVALAASRLDVPARLVVGAYPDRRGRVAETDVESWVEVQVDDGTWRIIRQPSYLGSRSIGPEQPAQEDPPATPPDDWLRDQRDPRLPDPAATPDAADEPGLGSALRTTGLALAGVLLLGVVLVPLVKLMRRRRRRRAGWPMVYVHAWQEVVDAARDSGRPVPEHLGRLAQARRLGTGLELARAADVAVFAPDPTADHAQQAFWDAAQAERRAVLAAAPLPRRLTASLHPGSLVSAWASRRPRGVPAGVAGS